MKRFVDLREMDLYPTNQFAWYDTVIDQFETHGDCQVWVSFEDFAEDYEGPQLERYMSLTPEWAFAK